MTRVQPHDTLISKSCNPSTTKYYTTRTTFATSSLHTDNCSSKGYEATAKDVAKVMGNINKGFLYYHAPYVK